MTSRYSIYSIKCAENEPDPSSTKGVSRDVAEAAHDRDSGPKPVTTAFADRSCGTCGRPLTGRKEKFCSTRCRMRAYRAARQQKRRGLLERLRQTLTELERELFDEGTDRG
jgi:hypothetical protein